MAESIFAFNYKLNPSYYAETLLHTAKFISQKRPVPPFPASFLASQTIFLISQVQCLSGSWVINEIPPCPQPPAPSLLPSAKFIIGFCKLTRKSSLLVPCKKFFGLIFSPPTPCFPTAHFPTIDIRALSNCTSKISKLLKSSIFHAN